MIFGEILHLTEMRTETRVTYTCLPCVLGASAIVFAFMERSSFVKQDNAERTHSTSRKIVYDSKLIIKIFPPSVTSQRYFDIEIGMKLALR